MFWVPVSKKNIVLTETNEDLMNFYEDFSFI